MSSLYIEKIDTTTFIVGEINGYKCKTINRLCEELRDTFKWPEHEICIEAMYHLDWFEETNFKIIVKKFNAIKSTQQQELIQHELNNYKEYWDGVRFDNNISDQNIFLIEYQ